MSISFWIWLGLPLAFLLGLPGCSRTWDSILQILSGPCNSMNTKNPWGGRPTSQHKLGRFGSRKTIYLVRNNLLALPPVPLSSYMLIPWHWLYYPTWKDRGWAANSKHAILVIIIALTCYCCFKHMAEPCTSADDKTEYQATCLNRSARMHYLLRHRTGHMLKHIQQHAQQQQHNPDITITLLLLSLALCWNQLSIRNAVPSRLLAVPNQIQIHREHMLWYMLELGWLINSKITDHVHVQINLEPLEMPMMCYLG